MKLSDLKQGDTIVADSGFTCISAGRHTVEQDKNGLFVKCAKGRHYLDGQEDGDGELVGISLPDQPRASGDVAASVQRG